MSTTTQAPRITREEAAERIIELLSDEPQAEAAIRRRFRGINGVAHGGTSDVVRAALGVLESRHEAMRLPHSAGSKGGGWVLYDAKRVALFEHPEQTVFPYQPAMVPVDQMFVDKEFQRPLTSFVDRLTARFNVYLFQPVSLSDRGPRHRPKRYSLVDGQTRWVAASRLHIVEIPSNIYRDLTPAAEADLFWRLQDERRGTVSFWKFRSKLRSGDKTALAIKALVESAGYKIGDRAGQIKATAVLEGTYRLDPYVLERTLVNLKATWPTDVPEGRLIRGLHYFFRHFPIGRREHDEVDDERLVNRLMAAGLDGIERKITSAREMANAPKGSSERIVGMAIQAIYLSGARK